VRLEPDTTVSGYPAKVFALFDYGDLERAPMRVYVAESMQNAIVKIEADEKWSPGHGCPLFLLKNLNFTADQARFSVPATFGPAFVDYSLQRNPPRGTTFIAPQRGSVANLNASVSN
jgi:hypothetical protein